MQKDIAEKRLESYPDVAADIINGAFYEGEAVVREEDLEQVDSISHTSDDEGNWHEWRRDLMFQDKSRECRYVFYGIENQTGVDNTMPLRIVGNDFSNYQRQVEKYMDQNKKEGNSAYAKRIHDDQKLIPTITVVLFYGEEWIGPKSLVEMLDLNGRKDIEHFLLNYQLNLIELGKDKEFYKKFHSDFRLIVRYLSVRKDKEELQKFLKDDGYKIRHVEEFLDVMSAISSDRRYREVKENIIPKDEKEELSMCLLLDMVEERGVARGIEQGIARGIERGKEQGAHIKALEIAGNLLRAGQNITSVAALTGLSESELSKIVA